MIYGIEESTDMRDPRTVIKKFTSVQSAKRWCANSGKFTHDNPETAQNYHHTFRTIYQSPLGWRLPSKKQIELEVRHNMGSIYSPSTNKVIATHIHTNCSKIDIGD